jgi:hypothetical protein
MKHPDIVGDRRALHFYGQCRACDHRCDQDGLRRTAHGETGRDRAAASAEVTCDIRRQTGWAGTAPGLLITQRSRVQIRPRYQGQRPFLEQGKGV